jgi:hypothetical protein
MNTETPTIDAEFELAIGDTNTPMFFQVVLYITQTAFLINRETGICIEG